MKEILFALRETNKAATGNDKRKGYELVTGTLQNGTLLGTLYMTDDEAARLRGLLPVAEQIGGAA